MRYTTAEHLEMNVRYGAHNYDVYPIVPIRGEGVWVWDNEGKEYIDCLGAYSAVSQGHCHPRIVRAIRRQAARLTVIGACFVNEHLGPFRKQLAGLCHKDKVLNKNTGTEAVEVAIKLARKWAYVVKGVFRDGAEIISIETSFHGRTYGSLSAMTHYREYFGPFLEGFVHIPPGDIEALKKAIRPNTAAVIIEPIQGEGGILVPPDGYLRAVRELCSEEKILFMVDEIQVGLGRTGKMFYCDYENVVPDVYILGKALGGGYPVSAIAANDDIMLVIEPGDDGSTFGGNPLACAVGMEALNILVDEKLSKRASVMGRYFRDGLTAMRLPCIKEVRGKGLLIGVEIRPEFGNAHDFALKLLREGVITKDTQETTLRFAPPLVITKKEVDFALEKFEKVFAKAL
jgi:ornithine--oxo-acid transaminase